MKALLSQAVRLAKCRSSTGRNRCRRRAFLRIEFAPPAPPHCMSVTLPPLRTDGRRGRVERRRDVGRLGDSVSSTASSEGDSDNFQKATEMLAARSAPTTIAGNGGDVDGSCSGSYGGGDVSGDGGIL